MSKTLLFTLPLFVLVLLFDLFRTVLTNAAIKIELLGCCVLLKPGYGQIDQLYIGDLHETVEIVLSVVAVVCVKRQQRSISLGFR